MGTFCLGKNSLAKLNIVPKTGMLEQFSDGSMIKMTQPTLSRFSLFKGEDENSNPSKKKSYLSQRQNQRDVLDKNEHRPASMAK